MGVLSWELFSWVNGIEAVCIGGLLWYIYQVRQSCLRDAEKLHTRISDHGNRLHDFVLEMNREFLKMSKEFASGDQLKEVEERLSERHKELVTELRGLRQDVQSLTQAMVKHVADDGRNGGD